MAEEYLGHFRHELDGKPLDRALLKSLVDEVGNGTRAVDLGCGPGHVGAWLAELGLQVVGIDLSPAMVGLGRRTYPNVEFRVGDLVELPADDGEFGLALAFYSFIHLDLGELEAAIVELHRVVRPGGCALIGFHMGSEVVHRDEWWGLDVDLDFRFMDADHVVELLERRGLEVQWRVQRRHYPDEVDTVRAYIAARRIR
ncbi:MAG: class I SAM-dependent methyltransferase [Acidimicrobiales bacterium]